MAIVQVVETWQWKHDPFELIMWDSLKGTMNRTRIGYEFYCNGKLIFEGNDYSPSPCHAIDSQESIAGLLGFLSLRPGDTDREYFEDYSPEQLAFANEHGEELSSLVYEMENPEDDQ